MSMYHPLFRRQKKTSTEACNAEHARLMHNNARLISENDALRHELRTARETFRSIEQWARSAAAQADTEKPRV